MVARHARNFVLAFAGALQGCTVVVDPGVTYCDRTRVVDEFSEPTFAALTSACWRVDNTDSEHAEIFLDSGDLVVRANPPPHGEATWVGGTQGAFIYQSFDDDFAMVARVEAVNQVSGDHCLEAGNEAGLVVRGRSPGLPFATLFIAPFVPNPPPNLACNADSPTYPPTRATMASAEDAWGPPASTEGIDQRGIGVDGEADLAVCRVNDTLAFFVRDPSSEPAAVKWDLLGNYVIGDFPFDVGLTTAGAPPTFAAEGHFTWVGYMEGLPADGCRGALETLVLPAFD
ncbi:MAG: hypothetical protein U0414_37720 [Polyangiaceae bacterium]